MVELARRSFTPTHRNMQVLLARCTQGSPTAAADYLNISVTTVHRHLTRLRLGYGFVDDTQLCFALSVELKALAAELRALSSDAAADTPSSAAAVEPNGA